MTGDLERLIRAIRGRVALGGNTVVIDVHRLVDEALVALAAQRELIREAAEVLERFGKLSDVPQYDDDGDGEGYAECHVWCEDIRKARAIHAKLIGGMGDE
jgi:hypothetical protein